MKSPWQQYTHQPDGSITLEGRPDIAIEVIEEQGLVTARHIEAELGLPKYFEQWEEFEASQPQRPEDSIHCDGPVRDTLSRSVSIPTAADRASKHVSPGNRASRVSDRDSAYVHPEIRRDARADSHQVRRRAPEGSGGRLRRRSSHTV